MPNSYTTLTLTAGSATNGRDQLNYGPFDFEYLNTNDIKFAVLTPLGPSWEVVTVASVDETTKLITLNSSLSSQFPLSNITTARIFRSTTTNALVDFTAGSRISESDLDTAYRQGLFAAQEAVEDASASTSRALTTNSDIQDGAVDADKLATDSVESIKIKDGAVVTSKLATDAVETVKIKNLNVTTPKLANNAVDTSKIANGSVVESKLAATLDLTSKTVTLPPDSVGYTQVDTATKTEMESQSSSGVCVPDTLKNHPGVAKAYGIVTFDTNTPAKLSDYNVASVSEPAEDTRRVTFTNAMNDANYVVQLMHDFGINENPPYLVAQTATYFDIDHHGVDADGRTIHFVVYGQLA